MKTANQVNPSEQGSHIAASGRVWIHGNNSVNTLWHVARTKQLTGEKSGAIFRQYEVALCSGRQLGGAWGHQSDTIEPILEVQCKRCRAAIARAI